MFVASLSFKENSNRWGNVFPYLNHLWMEFLNCFDKYIFFFSNLSNLLNFFDASLNCNKKGFVIYDKTNKEPTSWWRRRQEGEEPQRPPLLQTFLSPNSKFEVLVIFYSNIKNFLRVVNYLKINCGKQDNLINLLLKN